MGRVIKRPKTIHNNHSTIPLNFASNKIDSRRHSLITFLPAFFIKQLRFSINKIFFFLYILYFIFGTIGFEVRADIYLSSLVGFFFCFCNEAYMEIICLLRDKKLNSQVYTIIKDGEEKQIRSQDIKTGDIVKLKENERVPVDVVLLHCEGQMRGVYIKTDQIDGETDWKNKLPLKNTQKMINGGIDNFLKEKWSIKVESPNSNLKSFYAYFSYEGETEGVDIKNFIPTNSTIVVGEVYGLTVFVGKENKQNIDKSQDYYHVTQLDKDINMILNFIIANFLIVSIITTVYSVIAYNSDGYMVFFESCLMYSCYLSCNYISWGQISGGIHKVNMYRSGKMYGSKVINHMKAEELGRLEILLCDKTGTLTLNKLKLKKIITRKEQLEIKEINPILKGRVLEMCRNLERGEVLSEEDKNLYNIILCFLLCTNIAPTLDNHGRKKLKLSSPDEKAFLKFLRGIGFKINDFVNDILEIETPLNKILKFEVLVLFPFASSRKRMDVIVRDLQTNQITLFFKGADDVIRKRVSVNDNIFIKEHSEIVASQGLRTMTLAYKNISEEEFGNFKIKLNQELQNLEGREEMIDQLISKFEKGSQVLAVTGIEDLLQKDVIESLTVLRRGNIKTWMITGDKLETAKCVSVSSGLKPFASSFFTIDSKDEEEIENLLDKYNPEIHFLTMTGTVYTIIQKNKALNRVLLDKIVESDNICFCRFLPNQKAVLARDLIKIKNKIVCSVGDGANDIDMIRTCHVGIGIEGRCGQQASLSADFVVKEFKGIKNLIIYHGKTNYDRTAKLMGVLHTCLTYFSFVLFFFSTHVFFVFFRCFHIFVIIALPLPIMWMGYYVVLHDVGIPESQIYEISDIYKENQRGCYMKPKTLFLSNLQAIFQAYLCTIFVLYGVNATLSDQQDILAVVAFFVMNFIVFFNCNKIDKKHFYLTLYYVINVSLITKYAPSWFGKRIVEFDILSFSFMIALLVCMPVYIITKIRDMFFPDVVKNILPKMLKMEEERLSNEKVDFIDI